MKKNNTPHGMSLSPEFRELSKRLKRKEPELDAIIQAGEARLAKVPEYVKAQEDGA